MEHRPTSRAGERQAAGVNAFDGFRESRAGNGLDLHARRRRIDGMAGGGGGEGNDDNWRAPTRDEIDAIRAGRDGPGVETDPGTSDGTSLFSRWRGRIAGAIGSLRGRDVSIRPDASVGGTPPIEPPPTPSREPVSGEPDPHDSVPAARPAVHQAIPTPAQAAPDRSAVGGGRNTGADTDSDEWHVPDQAFFDAIRARRAGTTSAAPSPTAGEGLTIPPPPIPEGALTPETGGWRAGLKERVAAARVRAGEMMAGMRDGAGAIIDVAKGRVDAAKEWAERKADTPLGKIIIKAVEQVAKDIAEGRRRRKGGIAVQVGKFLALYGAYKAKEIFDEKKWDIATGVVTGAAVRPLLLMVGVETYIAGAGIAFVTGAARKGMAELNNYVTPETDGLRTGLREKIRTMDGAQRRELARKMLIAGAVSAGASFVGAGVMHSTGLDVMMKNAAGSGMDKVGGLFGGLKESLPQGSGGIPGLDSVEAAQPPNSFEPGEGISPPAPGSGGEVGGSASPPGEAVSRPGARVDSGFDGGNSLDSHGVIRTSPVTTAVGPPYGAEAEVGVSQGLPMTPVPDAAPVPVTSPVTTAVGPPYGAEAEVGVSQGLPMAPVPEVVPVLNPIDQVVDKLPAKVSLPQGATPWAIAEQLLKESNPNGQFTPADIMAVDKALCEANGVAVPEWGIEGKILATRLPVGMNFEITDDVKDVLKRVAKK